MRTLLPPTSRDLAAQSERGLEARLDRCLVRHRQHAGQAEADLADVRVGRVTELADRAAAEHLGTSARLDMDLHADDDFPNSSPLCGEVARIAGGARQRRPPAFSRRLPLRRSEPLARPRSPPTA